MKEILNKVIELLKIRAMNTKMPTRLNIVVVDLGFLKRNMELPTIEEKTTHSAYLEATLMEISKLMQFFEKRQFSIWKPYLVIGLVIFSLWCLHNVFRLQDQM